MNKNIKIALFATLFVSLIFLSEKSQSARVSNNLFISIKNEVIGKHFLDTNDIIKYSSNPHVNVTFLIISSLLFDTAVLYSSMHIILNKTLGIFARLYFSRLIYSKRNSVIKIF